MENELNELKDIWKSARGQTGTGKGSSAAIIQQARLKKKKALTAHYGNIGILTLVAILLWICFRVFFPFRETLSRAGVALMIGGLVIRVAIEMFSVIKSNKVNVSDTTIQATEDMMAFYLFRKRIHGPVTLIIVVLYISGFYMLSPEFSKYIETFWMVVFDGGFLVGATVLALFIRRGNQRELEELNDVVQLRKQLFQ